MGHNRPGRADSCSGLVQSDPGPLLAPSAPPTGAYWPRRDGSALQGRTPVVCAAGRCLRHRYGDRRSKGGRLPSDTPVDDEPIESPYGTIRHGHASVPGGLFVPKQVTVRAARAAACLTWEAPSVGVRWRPLLSVVIVTHLVTRSFASRFRERLLRKSLTLGSRPATPEVSHCFAWPRATATHRCLPLNRARSGARLQLRRNG